MRALVVDDSATIRLLLNRILGSFGYEVHCASGGTEALHYLSTGAVPDLFLFDWNMPDVTGLDLVKTVREQARFGASRILMVTSETDQELMRYALEAGASDYLMKPVNAGNLAQKLERMGMPREAEPGDGR